MRNELMKLPKVGIALMGVIALAGCTNYSGEGNEFVVDAFVTSGNDQSLSVRILEIDEARGWADDWFEIGKEHQIHDNCDCDGFFTSRKQYGHVINNQGQVIEPSEVQEGECVHIEGKIRTDNDGKYSHERPVYDIAQIVDCSSIDVI